MLLLIPAAQCVCRSYENPIVIGVEDTLRFGNYIVLDLPYSLLGVRLPPLPVIKELNPESNFFHTLFGPAARVSPSPTLRKFHLFHKLSKRFPDPSNLHRNHN